MSDVDLDIPGDDRRRLTCWLDVHRVSSPYGVGKRRSGKRPARNKIS